jgi:release factor glutamine methyltransferase
MTSDALLSLPSDIRAAMREAAAALADVSDTARLDAELLMAHSLGVERDRILLDPTRYETPAGYGALIHRRLAKEPVAYILGYRDFWSLRLAVGPGVLIPRPDSETLIEVMLAHVPDVSAPLSVLDLGTGPGTLLLAALSELPAATGLGVDASAAALEYACRNAESTGLANRAQFRLGNWGEGIDQRFDIILSNPPYIGSDEELMSDVVEFEPASALFAGADGLDDYRRLMPQFDRLLTDNGLVLLEIGYKQANAVMALAENAGFFVRCFSDLAGRDRALLLSRIAISA